MDVIRVAVAAPSASLYSETFVAMQMEQLPCVLRIFGAPVVEETVPGGPIRPYRSVRGLAGAVWSHLGQQRQATAGSGGPRQAVQAHRVQAQQQQRGVQQVHRAFDGAAFPHRGQAVVQRARQGGGAQAHRVGGGWAVGDVGHVAQQGVDAGQFALAGYGGRAAPRNYGPTALNALRTASKIIALGMYLYRLPR